MKKMVIDPMKKTQIKTQSKNQSGAQVGALIFDETLTSVLVEYSNYNNVFLVEYVAKFSEYIKINNHTIKLKESKQPFLA